MKVLSHLKRLQADVAILQESHLKEDDFYCMGKLGGGGSGVPLGGEEGMHKKFIVTSMYDNGERSPYAQHERNAYVQKIRSYFEWKNAMNFLHMCVMKTNSYTC